ncbi:hypothetical protein UT300012_21700 [Paraclostridium bifermentans]
MLKTWLATVVLVFAGGVHTPSALEGLEGIQLAYETDQCPSAYTDLKYLYENSMKAHGDYFLEPVLALGDYEGAIENFEKMLKGLKEKLPVNEYSKLECMYLEDMEFKINRMKEIKENLMVFEEDQILYARLQNTPTHRLAMELRQNIKDFYRLVWSK